VTADSLASYAFALRALRGGGTPAEMQERVIQEYLREHPEAQRTDLNVRVTETVTETVVQVMIDRHRSGPPDLFPAIRERSDTPLGQSALDQGVAE
jgi:hypothetical protein